MSAPAGASVELVERAALADCAHWQNAFAHVRKDRRYYEIVEDTIRQDFDYRYFIIKDSGGEVRAVQPCFIVDQDVFEGAGPGARKFIEQIRRVWPRFMRARTLMVGCAAGEGHLDADGPSAAAMMAALAQAIEAHARQLGASLIVLKEFPARYRPALASFTRAGFAQIPSMPMTRLDIGYPSFEDYMTQALSSKTRKDLRRKFRIAEQAAPLEMSVVADVGPIIDEIYPLYLTVYERSTLRFEKLSKEYFCRLGREMPDKVRFFIWRQSGRVVAFSQCMIDGEAIYTEYLGLDYTVALELHLYHYMFRDTVVWAIRNGFRSLHSTGLNYDPKLHLKSLLAPLDLYVRLASPWLNSLLKRFLPLLDPTRREPTLQKFANYHEMATTR